MQALESRAVQDSGRSRRRRGTTVAAYVAAIVVAGLIVLPLLFVVVDGFRTTAQINADAVGWPHPWRWSTYGDILGGSEFWRFLANSAQVAVTATALAVMCGALAAFALARYSFAGREALYGFYVLGLLLPPAVAALPLRLWMKNLGLLENVYGLGVAEAAFSLPVTIVILRPFLAAVPAELQDAAVIDGTSRLGFFWRIVLPLSGPALATVSVLAFVTSWNSYLLPLLVFDEPRHFTLPLGVATYQSQYSQDTAKIMAFTALSIVPAVVFLAVAERRIVGGLTGAVKG
ncbi:MAG: carbohydrate ABC transporter permease [Catenulispora sp.]|nr:carbohydrate ABC transporter permease [Catenulispora sp.]